MGKKVTKAKTKNTIDYFIFEPCPFCKNEEPKPNNTKPESKAMPRLYWVTCWDCGATGPDCKTLEEAIDKWDGRTS